MLMLISNVSDGSAAQYQVRSLNFCFQLCCAAMCWATIKLHNVRWFISTRWIAKWGSAVNKQITADNSPILPRFATDSTHSLVLRSFGLRRSEVFQILLLKHFWSESGQIGHPSW